jgi:uncharacterized glyoxalase superfamily protein PhnB
MLKRASPMFHVPDVGATADWYARLGFTVLDRGNDGGEIVWALISAGDSQFMLNTGGMASDTTRREADLYVQVDDADALFAQLPGDIDVVETPHDTFYGMREFIIRDLNRFWITFGQSLSV